MFEVTVAFPGNVAPIVRRFDKASDLGLYLESIPGNFGFLVNQQVSIQIQTLPTNQPELFELSHNQLTYERHINA